MKKPDLARRMARATGVTPAEAADRLDGVVRQILRSVRQGRPAVLPAWAFSHAAPMAAWRSSARRRSPDRLPRRNRVGDAAEVARAVVRSLAAGKAVEIDGLGVFYPDPERLFRFEPRRLPRVFVAYVEEDRPRAARLFDALDAAGFDPWMDVRKLLPGQNWPRAIEGAIEASDFFVACFSENSVCKKGGFQAEIRYALDCARQVPLDEIFIVPVRLDGCRIPRAIQREYHYVDLFPDWARGLRRLLVLLRRAPRRTAVDTT